MPSVSPSRYQSRLFNFVNQQSRRLGDRLQQSFRQMQVATSWSLEALLYPVYLLFQKAMDSAARQLNAKEQQTTQYLQANYKDSATQTIPSGDAPIQQVLHAVENLQQEVVVQGIASELGNRNLVLISTENQMLDILTQEQQKKLQERIIVEIAKYWREWRLSAEKNETKLLTEIDRLLTKLSSANPKTTPALQTETTVHEISLPQPYAIIALLDATVAKLESNALVPVQQQAFSLYQAVQTQLKIFVDQKEQQRVAKLEQENQWLNVQVLIWEAINFFFGKSPKSLVESDKINNYTDPVHVAIHPNESASQREVALPPSVNRINQTVKLGTLTKHIPEIQEIASKIGDWILGTGRNSQNFSFNSLVPSTQSPVPNPQYPISIQSFDTTEIEATPDWIETKAKIIGYERHPLEQILQWLDNIMLFLEEIFFKIVQFLQKLWQKR